MVKQYLKITDIMLRILIISFSLLGINAILAPDSNNGNDHIQIQEAICALLNATAGVDCGIKLSPGNAPSGPGGDVILDEGTFDIHQIYMYSNINLIGQGIGLTILRLQDEADSYYLNAEDRNNGQSGFIRSLHEANFSIKKMTLDGNKNNQINYELYKNDNNYIDGVFENGKAYIKTEHAYGRFGVYTEACDDVLLEELEVMNWQGYGLDPHGEGGSYYEDYSRYGNTLEITDCLVHDNDWDGITIDKSIYVTVKDNEIYNNGRHGINVVTGSRQVEIYKNIITNNGHLYIGVGKGCGIMCQNNQLYDLKDIYVHNNIVSESNNGGACFNSVTLSYLYNNDFSDNRGSCIRLGVQSNNSLILNDEQDPIADYGNATTTNDCEIYDNYCNSDEGIVISWGQRNNIYDNTIHTLVSVYGIDNSDELIDTATNTFSGNRFGGTVIGDILYADSGYVPIDHPYLEQPADPTCYYGTLNSNRKFCFESDCPQYGGVGCDGFCCTSTIIDNQWLCTAYAAPCKIDISYHDPVSDDMCVRGILSDNGAICCSSSCTRDANGIEEEYCGGSGCGLNGQSSNCCMGTISSSEYLCITWGPPCIMP